MIRATLRFLMGFVTFVVLMRMFCATAGLLLRGEVQWIGALIMFASVSGACLSLRWAFGHLVER